MQELARVLRASVAALLIGISSAGLADQGDIRGYDKAVDAFYAKPLKVQIATFHDYSFEEQFAIYIYGNQVRHPPATYLARPFASEGKTVVAPLTKKLMQTQDDLTIRDVVLVFSEMNGQRTYDVAADEELIRLLSSAVGRMKNPSWKAISAKELASLQGSRPGS